MSDELFDADRDSGLYPPKGWGWYTDEAKRSCLKRMVGLEDMPVWAIDECKRLGVDLFPKSCITF